MNRTFPWIIVAALMLSADVALSDSKVVIKKCQDAAGKWHYGDTAAEACATSKVTEISDQGIKKRVIEAPATADDIKRREAIEAEREKAKERSKQDEILLSTYSHEADIGYVRDRKLAQLEASIKASSETLASLRKVETRLQAQEAAEKKSNASTEQTTKMLEQTLQQIATHEAAVAQKRKEQELIRQRSEMDLKRYRELRTAAVPEPAKKP
jgi:hypothetical protein